MVQHFCVLIHTRYSAHARTYEASVPPTLKASSSVLALMLSMCFLDSIIEMFYTLSKVTSNIANDCSAVLNTKIPAQVTLGGDPLFTLQASEINPSAA